MKFDSFDRTWGRGGILRGRHSSMVYLCIFVFSYGRIFTSTSAVRFDKHAKAPVHFSGVKSAGIQASTVAINNKGIPYNIANVEYASENETKSKQESKTL
jgi:hypothetical protein